MDDVLNLWSVRVTLPDSVQEVEIELLGAPRPGWEITSEAKVVGSGPGSFEVVPLTSIDPGHHYKLDSSALGPEGSRAPTVAFTTDDLEKIGAGQVLSAISDKDFELISRDSFIQDRCG
jgi:hypothetical protein